MPNLDGPDLVHLKRLEDSFDTFMQFMEILARFIAEGLLTEDIFQKLDVDINDFNKARELNQIALAAIITNACGTREFKSAGKAAEKLLSKSLKKRKNNTKAEAFFHLLFSEFTMRYSKDFDRDGPKMFLDALYCWAFDIADFLPAQLTDLILKLHMKLGPTSLAQAKRRC